MFKIFFLTSLTLILSGFTQKDSLKSQFFYTVTEDSGNEIAYAIPECAELKKEEKIILKKCSKFGDHQMCSSNKTLEVTNVETNSVQKKTLIYHIFKNLKSCIKDRNDLLTSGGE